MITAQTCFTILPYYAIFHFQEGLPHGGGCIAGVLVTEGSVQRTSPLVRVIRNGSIIYEVGSSAFVGRRILLCCSLAIFLCDSHIECFPFHGCREHAAAWSGISLMWILSALALNVGLSWMMADTAIFRQEMSFSLLLTLPRNSRLLKKVWLASRWLKWHT